MPKKSRKSSERPAAAKRTGVVDADASYRAKLESEKRQSSIQVLFKVARLLDEEALRRVARRTGQPQLRRSHTSLLPHIDLEGTRITDLADRLGITKQAVSQLVDDLEALDVLARVPDPEDARAKRVVFTAKGRTGLLEGLAVLRALEGELEARVGKAAMAALRNTLLAIHDDLCRDA
ncbi:MAG: MarR family transcriptional regulator [Myxococcales bacterium]